MSDKEKKAEEHGKHKHKSLIGRLFWGLGWLLCLLTISGMFGAVWWGLDLAANFRVQYTALLLLWLAAAVWYLRWFTALVYGSMLLVNVALLLPYLSYPADGHGKYKLMAANIDYENPDLGKAEKVLRKENPDFIVLLEAHRDWARRMPQLAAAYPYFYEAIETKPSRIVILSRYPAKAHPLRTWDYNPGLFAEMKLEGRNFTLVGIHPSSPKIQRDHQDRKLQYQQLAYFFTQTPPGELVVAGDFNSSPWSYYYRILTSRMPFKSAMEEFGLHLTYPVGGVFMGVPIDQCLHTEGVILKALRRGDDLGSDHYPMIMEFDLRAKAPALPGVLIPSAVPGAAAPR